jgi:hypothetical protein
MKEFLLIFGFSLLAVAIPYYHQIFAVDGCCKERSSLTSEWRRNGMSFPECEKSNRSKDGDNVFDQRGFVWWDVRC